MLGTSRRSSQSRDFLSPPNHQRARRTSHPPRPAVMDGRGGGGGATKFLSRSNPPSTDSPGSKRGGRGDIIAPPLRVSANSPFSPHSTKGSGRPALTRGGRIGERDELPSFLKYGHIPPTIAIPGRPKEIVPKSWRALSNQKSLEAEKLELRNIPLRRRSLTVPSNSQPKTKPGEGCCRHEKGILKSLSLSLSSALQTALEQSCLGEYYTIFAEQEVIVVLYR